MRYCIHVMSAKERAAISEFLSQHATQVVPAQFRNTRVDFVSDKGITELRSLLASKNLPGIISQVSAAAYGVG